MYHGIAHKLIDCHAVETTALTQSTGIDCHGLERESVRCKTCRAFKVVEQLDATNHLAYCVGAEKIEIDAVEQIGVAAFIASRPLL